VLSSPPLFQLVRESYTFFGGRSPALSSSLKSLPSAQAPSAVALAGEASLPNVADEEERLGRFHATATGFPSLAERRFAKATDPSSPSLPLPEDELARSNVVAVACLDEEEDEEDAAAGAPRAKDPSEAPSRPSGAAHTSSCLPKSKTAKETASPAHSSEKARSGGGRVIFVVDFLKILISHSASMNALSDFNS